MITIRKAAEGSRGRIAVIVNSTGRTEVGDFIDQLPTKQMAKLDRLFERFCDRGVITNREKFRHEGNGLYVFKVDQIRIFGFFLPDDDLKTTLVVHGYIKKSKKAPIREMTKANKLKQQVESEGYRYE